MILLTEERVRAYPPIVKASLLIFAVVVMSLVFRITFWREVHIVFFTDARKLPSDYAGAFIGVANAMVIILTVGRIAVVLSELRKRAQMR